MTIKFNMASTIPWHRSLSPDFPCPLLLEKEGKPPIIFMSVNHAYYYYASTNKIYRDKIVVTTDYQRLLFFYSDRGRTWLKDNANAGDVLPSKTWEEGGDRAIMARYTRKKFKMPVFKKLLLATKDEKLIFYTSFAGDYCEIWGSGKDGDGSNRYGKLLMKIRGELQAKEFSDA